MNARPTPSLLNLATPPSRQIDSPEALLARLRQLAFFDRTPDAEHARIAGQFVDLCRQVKHDPDTAQRDCLAPGRLLLDPAVRRAAPMDIVTMAAEGGAYVVRRVRPLLAERGVELPLPRDERSTHAWTIHLDGLQQQICRLKNHRPLGEGLQHPINLATKVLIASCRLLNRWLATHGSDLRVCTYDDMRGSDSHIAINKGLMVLNDELSYLFMWTALLGCYCRVIRADVF